MLTYEKDHSIGSQNQMIKEALLLGQKITALEALERFGCLRLSGRIFDLRDEGLNIITEKKKLPNGKIVAEYYIPIPKTFEQGEFEF